MRSHPDSNDRVILVEDITDYELMEQELDHEAKPINFENGTNRELLVLADSQRLLQIFINLLGNARDACDPGGIVSVQAKQLTDWVTIDVTDNGCGIPADHHAQVFDPFYTCKDPGEGTGLGLALIYTIMEDMGGNVQLESPIDDNVNHPDTRVTVELPLGRYGSEFEV